MRRSGLWSAPTDAAQRRGREVGEGVGGASEAEVGGLNYEREYICCCIKPPVMISSLRGREGWKGVYLFLYSRNRKWTSF